MTIVHALARLLVRGPAAPHVLGDLDECFQRDLARGVPLRRARLRFLLNAVASGVSLLRARIPGLARPLIGPSWIDLKLGWRMLRKNPLLTAVAALSLGVGIPVGLAPVHVMEAFDAPPPVAEADRLMGLRHVELGKGNVATTAYELAAWQRALTSFEALAAFREVDRNLAAQGAQGAAVAAAEVTSTTFSALRTRPFFGRVLEAGDDAPGAPNVVLLGYDVWRSRFAGAPDIVGSTVLIGGVPHVVVGIMPDGFLFPISQSMWLPLRPSSAAEPGQGAPLRVFGRLAKGVSATAAESEFRAVHARMAAQFPEPYARVGAEVVSLSTLLNGYPKGGMRAIGGLGPLSFIGLLQTLSLIMLAVACANVGLLIFASIATRSSELAMRTALGASRARIVGQVATEALVLALVAAVVGLALMHWLPNRIMALMWSPNRGGLPWWIDLGLTPITVVRALFLAALSATAAAVIPALRVTGKAVRRTMQSHGEGGYGIRFGGLWSALIITDVACAVAAVGMVVGLSARMQPITSGASMAGFKAEEYLAAQLQFPDGGADAATDSSAAAAWTAQRAASQLRLVQRLEAEPGVRGVAVAERLPRMDHGGTYIQVEQGPPTDVAHTRVDPGFFEALDQPLLAGRSFNQSDLEGTRSTVIVNSVLAQLLELGNPVGKRLRYSGMFGEEPGPWYEIVGMVGDLGMDLVQPENAGGVYHPVAPGELATPQLAIHLASDPAAFVPRVHEIAAQVDPSILVQATPLHEMYPGAYYFFTGLMIGWTLFVAVLLALAGSGVYAIMAFSVAQRTREIGIRSALGARAIDIVSAIGRRAALQLGSGALIGMPIAGYIYFIIREDSSARLETFFVAVVPGFLIVLLVGLLACTVPLLRALRITSTEAMKGG